MNTRTKKNNVLLSYKEVQRHKADALSEVTAGFETPELQAVLKQEKERLNKEMECLIKQEYQGRTEQAKELFQKHESVFNSVQSIEQLRDAVDGMMHELQENAHVDELTKLSTRNALFDQKVIENYFSSVEAGGVDTMSVVSLDVDFFKAYNAISHTFGDVALQRIGKALLELSNESDGMGIRLGGEEIFLVLEKNLTADAITDKAQKIQQTITQALHELFAFYDAEKERVSFKPDMSTQEYLEQTILTEPRSRKGINEEWFGEEYLENTIDQLRAAGVVLPAEASPVVVLEAVEAALPQNPKLFEDVHGVIDRLETLDEKRKVYTIAVEKVKDKGVFISDDIMPADFLLVLQEKIRVGNENASLFREIMREDLGFTVGTATMGVLHVNFRESAKVNLEDAFDLQNKISKYNLPLPAITGRTYKQVNELMTNEVIQREARHVVLLQGLFTAAPGSKDRLSMEKEIEYLLKTIFDLQEVQQWLQKKRFGRVIDKANMIAEQQKLRKRNSIDVAVQSIGLIDQTTTQEQPERFVRMQKRFITLQKELVARQMASSDLPPNDKYTQVFNTYSKLDRVEAVVAEQRKLFMKIQRNRYYDPLTKAKNYRYLTTVLPEQAKAVEDYNKEQGTEYDFSLISFDLDNLKALNEVGGHKLGDVVLAQISETLQSQIELLLAGKKPYNKLSKDVLKRLQTIVDKTGAVPEVVRATGGEEFVVTFPGLDASEAHEAFEIMKTVAYKVIRRFIAKDLKLEKQIQTYLKKQGKTGKGIDEFGSFTAGIVSLNQLKAREYEVTMERDGQLLPDIGKMRQLADEISERLKVEKYPDGESGRGHIWELEVFEMAEQLDHTIAEKELLATQNSMLALENESLINDLNGLRTRLKAKLDRASISKVLDEINEKY